MRTGPALACLLLLAACTSGTGDPPGPSRTPTPPGSVAPHSSPLAGPSTPLPPVGVSDWPTYHGSSDRSGVSRTMPPVRGSLRIVQSLALDGEVYAAPIVAGSVTIVATEKNTVYAFGAGFAQLWKRNLGEPSPAAERDCGNIDPLGITGTPVYDPAAGSVFVSPELGSPPRHRLVALELRTGAVRWNRSIDLPGVQVKAMQERGALSLAAGRVWVPFGGLAGDCGGYKGRLVGVRLNGAGPALSYTVPTSREAGIWAPPGPSVDAEGNLLVAVGNGAAGAGDAYDYSDSVLKIAPDATLRDSFSPPNWAADNAGDLDLGSQGPTLVGWKWVFIAGKSGVGYVLRQRRFGGIGGEAGRAEVCASFGGTAVDRGTVYVPCVNGVRAVRIDASGTPHVRWHAAPSGSPVVGGGRVWSLDPSQGVLHALDPKTGDTLARVTVGAVSRFATPALHGRDVLVGTLAGLVVVRTS